MTTKFLTIKFAKFPNYIVMEFPRKNSVFGKFSPSPTPSTPSKKQILLILSFRRLWVILFPERNKAPRAFETMFSQVAQGSCNNTPQIEKKFSVEERQPLLLHPPGAHLKGLEFGDKFGESLGGSQAPPSFWKVPGLPRKFPELPRKFSATSPEVLSLWDWIAIQRFPGSFPDFPGSFPDFPGSSPDFPGGQPFLWEAWHPLLTHKNFLWWVVTFGTSHSP